MEASEGEAHWGADALLAADSAYYDSLSIGSHEMDRIVQERERNDIVVKW